MVLVLTKCGKISDVQVARSTITVVLKKVVPAVRKNCDSYREKAVPAVKKSCDSYHEKVVPAVRKSCDNYHETTTTAIIRQLFALGRSR